jgi:hypothetical protein
MVSRYATRHHSAITRRRSDAIVRADRRTAGSPFGRLSCIAIEVCTSCATNVATRDFRTRLTREVPGNRRSRRADSNRGPLHSGFTAVWRWGASNAGFVSKGAVADSRELHRTPCSSRDVFPRCSKGGATVLRRRTRFSWRPRADPASKDGQRRRTPTKGRAPVCIDALPTGERPGEHSTSPTRSSPRRRLPTSRSDR